VLTDGESEVLNEIAKRVREWHGRWDDVWENIQLRAAIKESLLSYADRLGRPELLEADWTVDSNEAMHVLSEQAKSEVGSLDPKMIYGRWEEWLKARLKQGARTVA
jgi:hypothetical protein